jgi:hypothetical protein
MDNCGICAGVIEGPSLSDLETGTECHPACVAGRVPEEAVVALIAATLLVLVPAIVVWAG